MTRAVLPSMATSRTRSPEGMSLSATQTHSSLPSIGFWNRTRPFWKGETLLISNPTSPITLSAVQRTSGCLRLNSLNQANVVIEENSTHSSTCMSSCRLGAASAMSETSTAPMPNQMMKNVGRTSSSRIRPMPKTSQIHHCISI